jgi:UDP-3-O-[3-hydroxymyristoyl] glucosamine N-acyltransferase
MEHAGPGELTFLANPKYAPKVNTRGRAPSWYPSRRTRCERSPRPRRLLSANPYLDFARALGLFYQPPRPAPGIHPLAYVAPKRPR